MSWIAIDKDVKRPYDVKIRFTKMHGAGNDFIIVDEFHKILIPEKKKSGFSAWVSDRHFGIGSDGVIFVQKSKTEYAKMLFYNPDGGKAEICGNGVRCFAKYLYDRKIIKSKKIGIETSSGRVVPEILIRGQSPRSFDTKGVELNEDKRITNVRVDMGSPVVEFINRIIQINGNSFEVTSINMGNPHAVLFPGNIEKIDVKAIGSSIRNLRGLFKNGANVHFIQKVGKNRFKIRSYERGVEDETLACGTGICASGVAAVMNKLANGKKPIKFHACGGDLIVELEIDQKNRVRKVYMTGPAEEVFTGEIEFPQRL